MPNYLVNRLNGRGVAGHGDDRGCCPSLRDRGGVSSSTAQAPVGALPVLVADDDDAVRSTLCEILRHAGYTVFEAEDGDVALEQLKRHEVAVLVLDIRMPKRDGVAVLDALNDPPVVLLVSAFSVDQETRDRIGPKVHRYLRKPVAPQYLLDCIAEALALPTNSGDR
jgi:CheY-like chemotaxis protein